MARKRIEMTPSVVDEIKTLMAAGGTVESVTATLRAGSFPGASSATVGRRMAEMRAEAFEGRVARRNAAAVAPPAAPVADEPAIPARPEDIPEGTGLERYDLWIERVERMVVEARLDEDPKTELSAMRQGAFLLDMRRKAAPPKVEDPNQHPDMVALGAEVEVRFLKMVDLVLETM
jgi:hypothetical protein